MDSDAYQLYLQSDQWKSLRVTALNLAGHRCQLCNSPDGLDVHHRTYERVGNEQVGDLTVLCDRCHTLFHEQSQTPQAAVLIETGINEAYNRFDARKKNADETGGLPSGFSDLDRLTDGFRDSELTVVSSRPGAGKTAFLHDNMRHLSIDRQIPVVLFSLKETLVRVAERLLSSQSKVDGRRLQNATTDLDETDRVIQAGSVLQEKKLFIDTHSRSITHIVTRLRQLHEEHGIRAVFIDCLDLVEGSVRESRYEQIAGHGRRLRRMAKDLEIPVIVTARAKRPPDDRLDQRTRLSDLGFSIGLEHDADRIILLNGPDMNDPTGFQEGYVEVSVAKNRSGPTGEISLLFEKACGRFSDFKMKYPQL